MKKIIVGIVIGGISIFFLFFMATCFLIGRDVRKKCGEAKKQYTGNCVEALTSLLNDENQSFRARNSAIWTLGQLGNSYALPVLEKYYTGNIPPRESLDKMISQYELKKAIKLASGGLNITAFFWRSEL